MKITYTDQNGKFQELDLSNCTKVKLNGIDLYPKTAMFTGYRLANSEDFKNELGKLKIGLEYFGLGLDGLLNTDPYITSKNTDVHELKDFLEQKRLYIRWKKTQ